MDGAVIEGVADGVVTESVVVGTTGTTFTMVRPILCGTTEWTDCGCGAAAAAAVRAAAAAAATLNWCCWCCWCT